MTETRSGKADDDLEQALAEAEEQTTENRRREPRRYNNTRNDTAGRKTAWAGDGLTPEGTTRQQAERRLIGCVLNYAGRAAEVFDGSIPDGSYFQNKNLGKMYDAAAALFKAGRRTDHLGIRKWFQDQGAVPNWLTLTVTDATSDAESYPAVIEDCKRIIIDDTHLAEFRRLSRAVRNKDDVLRLARLALDWDAQTKSAYETPWPAVVDSTIDRAEAIKNGSAPWGHGWGLKQLDRHLVLAPGKTFVIGGAKKTGKTLFLIHMLRHNLLLDPPTPCALFSLEMTKEEIARRVLSSESGVDSRRIFSPFLTDIELAHIRSTAEKIKRSPLTVCDNALLTSDAIASRMLRWKLTNRVPDGRGIVALDFMQMLQGDRRRNESEASALARAAQTLTATAKELQCALVLLVQLRNEAEGEVPRQRYIQGSGSIAQYAEAVLLTDLESRRDDNLDPRQHPQPFNIRIDLNRSGESGVVVPCQVDLRVGHFAGVVDHG